MSGIVWRWEERDLGFRFRQRTGRRVPEYYQAREVATFYVVPQSQRKLSKVRIGELAAMTAAPSSLRVVPNPWRNYQREWDWIETDDGICFNYAGCLDKEEIDRREDEGVQRAMELVIEVAERSEPVPLTLQLIRQIHAALMGNIYPFSGEWRKVSLTKGEGPTKWPLPPGGIEPLMDNLERDVLSRSPAVFDDDDEVFAYISEVMNELIAIHPFREGNGRTAFIICNLILMQNSMLPLSVYERRDDERRYFDVCEAGRLEKNYAPLASLLAEWEDQARARWQTNHEQ